ncbi:MAG TPA: hypothetical protein VFI18_04525 [Gaiellales bacterium]|nr:hypothetical protein [Gaiellales bacterium]
MLQPTDTQARQLIAAERIERLRHDTRPRVPGTLRRRAGAFLVASGLRLAGAYPSLLRDGAADHTTVSG